MQKCIRKRTKVCDRDIEMKVRILIHSFDVPTCSQKKNEIKEEAKKSCTTLSSDSFAITQMSTQSHVEFFFNFFFLHPACINCCLFSVFFFILEKINSLHIKRYIIRVYLFFGHVLPFSLQWEQNWIKSICTITMHEAFNACLFN